MSNSVSAVNGYKVIIFDRYLTGCGRPDQQDSHSYDSNNGKVIFASWWKCLRRSSSQRRHSKLPPEIDWCDPTVPGLTGLLHPPTSRKQKNVNEAILLHSAGQAPLRAPTKAEYVESLFSILGIGAVDLLDKNMSCKGTCSCNRFGTHVTGTRTVWWGGCGSDQEMVYI